MATGTAKLNLLTLIGLEPSGISRRINIMVLRDAYHSTRWAALYMHACIPVYYHNLSCSAPDTGNVDSQTNLVAFPPRHCVVEFMFCGFIDNGR